MWVNSVVLGRVAGAYFASAKSKYWCDAGLISWGVDFRARKSGGQEVTLFVIAVSLWTEGAEQATGCQFPNLFGIQTLITYSTYSNTH